MSKKEDRIITPSRYIESQRINFTAHESADIRGDKVADLKNKIVSGEYKVVAEQVVESILQHGLRIISMLNDGYNVI